MTRRGLSPAALDRVRDLVAPSGRVARVRPLRGGISSSVHLVTLQSADGARNAVVVRRYGEYYRHTDAAACVREYRLLEVLSRSALPVPRPLLLDETGGPFGAPTVVMTRLPGKPLLAPRDLPDYLRQLARTLARLHALPVDDLAFLPDQREFVDRSFLRYRGPHQDRMQQRIWSEAKAAWPRLREAGGRRTLVHGDYWPGNTLWRRGRLTGVVDWEQPRLGAPTRDVATCRGDLSILFGLEAADAFMREYQNASDAPLEDRRFWELQICIEAVRDIREWSVVYPLLGRPDLTLARARQRIRAFARRALES